MAKANNAKALRADIFKVATRTDTPTELGRLLEFITKNRVNIPLAVMGMGRLGAISRVLLARAGSVLIYASVGAATDVEGQMSLKQRTEPGRSRRAYFSRFAGAAEQMKEALIVNPYDVEEMADNIKVALEMGLTERQERHQALLAGRTSPRHLRLVPLVSPYSRGRRAPQRARHSVLAFGRRPQSAAGNRARARLPPHATELRRAALCARRGASEKHFEAPPKRM